jgi:hypothetical protein
MVGLRDIINTVKLNNIKKKKLKKIIICPERNGQNGTGTF